MNDSGPKNRRRFLEGVSVGGGALLAGCTSQFDLGGADQGTTDDASEGTTDGTGEGTTGETESDGVAAIATVDQQAMQEEQAALQEDVRNGNVSQQEAQEKMATIQAEYVNEATNALTETLEEADGVSVDERYDSLGAATIDGDAEAILDVLASDEVNALVSAAAVEQQAAMQTEQG